MKQVNVSVNNKLLKENYPLRLLNFFIPALIGVLPIILGLFKLNQVYPNFTLSFFFIGPLLMVYMFLRPFSNSRVVFCSEGIYYKGRMITWESINKIDLELVDEPIGLFKGYNLSGRGGLGQTIVFKIDYNGGVDYFYVNSHLFHTWKYKFKKCISAIKFFSNKNLIAEDKINDVYNTRLNEKEKIRWE
jgi:hypothetical protein